MINQKIMKQEYMFALAIRRVEVQHAILEGQRISVEAEKRYREKYGYLPQTGQSNTTIYAAYLLCVSLGIIVMLGSFILLGL